MTGAGHRPVLLDEAIEALSVSADGAYLDATFGRGGHSARLLEQLGPGGRLYAMDRDPDAVLHARQRFGSDPRFRIWHGNFAELEAGLDEMGCSTLLAGVLLDLGVSSPQLDEAGRGFSFQSNGPLDMRMDYSRGQSAAEWLAAAAVEEIERVLRDYGEERFARRVAARIVEARSEAPITSTRQLAELVAAAVPTREPGKHPATRTFQALRIAVNDELGAIGRALERAVGRLAPGGRLVVISFHSLEDRLVKQFIKRESSPPAGNRRLPAMTAPRLRLRRIGGAVRPGRSECDVNPRARSAVMRIAERTDA